MLQRNLVRLHANFHHQPPPPANFDDAPTGNPRASTTHLGAGRAPLEATWPAVATIAAAVACGAAAALLLTSQRRA